MAKQNDDILDDLRRSAGGDFGNDFDDDDGLFDDGDRGAEPTFLGMTAVERMFLSMFFFMNVVVLGIALLLATGRLVL